MQTFKGLRPQIGGITYVQKLPPAVEEIFYSEKLKSVQSILLTESTWREARFAVQ
jgi:hypothetical protein